MNVKMWLWVAGVVGLLATPTLAQPAPDCSRAKTAAEKAICADPKLTAADSAMGKAFGALKAALPAEQQAGLLSDQRQWIVRRDARCSEKQGADLAGCLLDRTEARRRFLLGEGPDGADAPRLMPAFFNEVRKGRYEISIAYPKMADTAGPAAAVFNRAAHTIAFGKDAVGEYRKMEKPPVPGASNFYQVTYEITYLDARLAAVVFSIAMYTGGAHPNSGRMSLLFDLAQKRSLKLADFLTEPKSAVADIAARCKAQLEAEAKKEDWELFDNADVGAVVGDVGNWAVAKTGVEILFDPYSVAAYVVGPRQCRLDYPAMASLLKPGGPLPPH